jgi:hypothetical protein
MRKFSVLVVFVLFAAVASTAQAKWKLYQEEGDVIASYDRAPAVRGMPTLWARWTYGSPQAGAVGVKKRFAADCTAKKMYEIYSNPFDKDGKYLGTDAEYSEPLEIQVDPGSLHEATYKLLCF